mmetsp:Transcript_34660/g.81622  ORF Transcript_34660/g.81622 Transcript_34660/m.81622 type:complete len:477 (-) Transcript_34660:199-1629(-)
MHPIHFPPDSALDVSTLRALVHCDSHVWGQAISADLDSLAAGFAEHVVEVVGLLLGAHKGAETAPDQLQERHREEERIEDRHVHGVEVGEKLEVLDLGDEDLGDGRGVHELAEGRGAQLGAGDRADEDDADVEEEGVHHRPVEFERVDADEEKATRKLDRPLDHAHQNVEGENPVCDDAEERECGGQLCEYVAQIRPGQPLEEDFEKELKPPGDGDDPAEETAEKLEPGDEGVDGVLLVAEVEHLHLVLQVQHALLELVHEPPLLPPVRLRLELFLLSLAVRQQTLALVLELQLAFRPLLDVDGDRAVDKRGNEVHGQRNHANPAEDRHQHPADEAEEREHVDDERGADLLDRVVGHSRRHVFPKRRFRGWGEEARGRGDVACGVGLHDLDRELHIPDSEVETHEEDDEDAEVDATPADRRADPLPHGLLVVGLVPEVCQRDQHKREYSDQNKCRVPCLGHARCDGTAWIILARLS